jgi:hypothetical protein
MVKTFDAIDSYLRQHHGETHVPLTYLVRTTVEVAPEDDDLAGNYITVEEEQIARSPHADALGIPAETYAADNKKVFEILQAICHDTNAWTWIKSFARRRDSRGAYMALYNHYLGASKADNIQAKAEKKLQTTFYSGDKQKFTFKKLVQIHKDQHTALKGLEQYGFPRLDERSKVRYLNNAITTKNLNAIRPRYGHLPFFEPILKLA